MRIKKGTLVKAKPGTAEGEVDKLGFGVVIDDPYPCPYSGKPICHVQWIRGGKPWMRYEHDLEIISVEK